MAVIANSQDLAVLKMESERVQEYKNYAMQHLTRMMGDGAGCIFCDTTEGDQTLYVLYLVFLLVLFLFLYLSFT